VVKYVYERVPDIHCIDLLFSERQRRSPQDRTQINNSIDEIVRLDINHDGKPDILERWWNGKARPLAR
jgi:hypothetical protein